jgi:hypothetical protein
LQKYLKRSFTVSQPPVHLHLIVFVPFFFLDFLLFWIRHDTKS